MLLTCNVEESTSFTNIRSPTYISVSIYPDKTMNGLYPNILGTEFGFNFACIMI